MSLSSRNALLDRLRKHALEESPLPDVIQGEWVRYDDPVEQLRKVIESVGGAFHLVPDMQAVKAVCSQSPGFGSDQKWVSLVPEIASPIDLASFDDPHQLEDMQSLVAAGDWVVAENAAVWVTDRNVRHRVIFFLCQQLALVVRRSTIVHNMHQAYERIQIPRPGFGCFISGPSKTADIEQSLVVGAHGCRAMQLFLIED